MTRNLAIILKGPNIFFGLFLLLLLNCTSAENEAMEIVKRSIEAHGGEKQYKALKAVSFKKTSRLFLEDGSLEFEVIQKQSFEFQPSYRVQIEWDKDGDDHRIFYDGKKAVKTVNGQVLKDSLDIVKAENAAKAAGYVFFQPFELLKEGTTLELDGTVKLNDSTDAMAVKVKYNGDTDESDKWTYYFNDDDLLIANSVILMDHNSLIENLEFQKVSGFIFNKHRKSYRVDKDLNKKYLRAEYFYNSLSISN